MLTQRQPRANPQLTPMLHKKEEGSMKKKFTTPEIETIVLNESEEILTASGEANDARDNETPDW